MADADRWQRDLQIAKTDDDERLVFGFLSVPTEKSGALLVDSQGDVIKTATLEKAVYKFNLYGRKAGDSHQQIGVGRLVESMIFTKEKIAKLGIPEGVIPDGAWWVGFYVDNDETWKAVKSGQHGGFSIGGTAKRIPYAEAA